MESYNCEAIVPQVAVMSPPNKKGQVGMMSWNLVQVQSTKVKDKKKPEIRYLKKINRKLVGKLIKCIKGFSNVLL